MTKNKNTQAKQIIQTNKAWPMCNQDFSMAENSNFGYARGMFPDGTPFAAEVSYDNVSDATSLALYFQPYYENEEIPLVEPPELFSDESEDNDYDEENPAGKESTMIPIEDMLLAKNTPEYIQMRANRLLWIGMSSYEDDEGDIEDVQDMIAYLKEQKVIEFTTKIENGYMLQMEDLMGQEIVLVSVALLEGDKEVCKTPIKFTPFSVKKSKLRLVDAETLEENRLMDLRDKVFGE